MEPDTSTTQATSVGGRRPSVGGWRLTRRSVYGSVSALDPGKFVDGADETRHLMGSGAPVAAAAVTAAMVKL